MVFDFYVYVYFRPNGIPCYIGKGRGRRFTSHLHRRTNPHLSNIIAAAGGDLPRAILRGGLTEAEAIETEVALIAAIGRESSGGPLVNLTDGGEGTSGYVQSNATKAKRSAALKGVPKTQEHAAAAGKAAGKSRMGTKIPCSESRRAAISAAKKGVKMREEVRLAMIGKKYSPERCAAISKALTGRTRKAA